MHKIVVAILVASGLLAGCADGSGQRDIVARPKAYPRPTLYDTIYCDRGLPAGFAVNSSAEALDITPADRQSDSDPRWFDISYPAYGATLHCTFIPADSTPRRDQLLANRQERMLLNLGDNFAEQTELTSTFGGKTLILTTAGTTLTPLQFLSESQNWIISGGLQFHADSIDADSVMPMIEAVRTDIIHAARQLK